MADDNSTMDNVTITAPPNVTGDGQQPQGATFTQEQVNAIVADRLRREREKYTDYDELKAAREELQETLADTKKSLEEKEQAIADFQENIHNGISKSTQLKLTHAVYSEAWD